MGLTNGELWSNQAVAIIRSPNERVEATRAKYIAASKRASELFGIRGQLAGRTLAQFVVDRQKDMPSYQFEAFEQEQAQLTVEATNTGPIVIARIPIVIPRKQPRSKKISRNGHPPDDHKGRAYLPIIVNYHRTKDFQEHTVLYLDVTSQTVYMHDNIWDRWCFVSSLNPRAEDLVIRPELDDSERTDRVFLAYNSKDIREVKEFDTLLNQHGCNAWVDYRCLKPGQDIKETIEDAMTHCRAALVFVGKNGFGRYLRKYELPELLSRMEDNGLKVIPILLGGLAIPPGLLRRYRGIRFELANTLMWVRGFLRDIMLG